MTEIGDPEEIDIFIEPVIDPIPRIIPVAPVEGDEWDVSEEDEEEFEILPDRDRELIPA